MKTVDIKTHFRCCRCGKAQPWNHAYQIIVSHGLSDLNVKPLCVGCFKHLKQLTIAQDFNPDN